VTHTCTSYIPTV